MAKTNLGKSQSTGPVVFDVGVCQQSGVQKKRLPLSPEVQTLSSRIDAALRWSELPGTALDKAAGVHQGRVSRLTRGERLQNIPVDTIVKLARALCVRPAWLLTGDGDMPEKLSPADVLERAAEQLAREKPDVPPKAFYEAAKSLPAFQNPGELRIGTARELIKQHIADAPPVAETQFEHKPKRGK